jgi:hypothetical protein
MLLEKRATTRDCPYNYSREGNHKGLPPTIIQNNINIYDELMP